MAANAAREKDELERHVCGVALEDGLSSTSIAGVGAMEDEWEAVRMRAVSSRVAHAGVFGVASGVWVVSVGALAVLSGSGILRWLVVSLR